MTINELNQLLITREELLAVGINENTLEQSIKRNTLLSVERGVYLYARVPRDWQVLVEKVLCGGMDAYSYTVERERNEVLLCLLPVLSESDKAVISGYKIGKVCKQTGVVIPTTTLPKAKQEAYMLKCRWLSLLLSLDDVMGEKAKREAFNRTHKTRFDGKVSFRLAVLSLCNTNGKKLLPNNLRKLNELMQEYKNEGATAVISGRWGKANAEKLGDEQTEFLVAIMGKQGTTGYKHATEIYNRKAKNMGWEEVNEKTVFNRLTMPEFHTVWYMEKYGFAAWKKIYEFSLTTIPASFKNALWVYDDTKHNLFYQETVTLKGKEQTVTAARLNVACIMDAYSKKILSRVFFEGKPSVEVVQECMRQALASSGGVLPYQILYDGDSAPVNYFKRFHGVHFKAMPYNGQSKPIETRFGQIQQKFYRVFPHHTGQNVTAKAAKSKVNQELHQLLAKANELPSKEKAIEEGKLIFLMANKHKNEGKLSADELYEQGSYPADYTPRKLGELDRISLLWQQHDSTRLLPYTNEGLEIQVSRTKYQYVGLNEYNLPDQNLIGHSFRVFYNPDQLEKAVALYTEDYRFVKIAYEKEKFARAVYDMNEGERSRLTEILTHSKGRNSVVAKQINEQIAKLNTKYATDFGSTNEEAIGLYYAKEFWTEVERAFLAEQEQTSVEYASDTEPEAQLQTVVVNTQKTTPKKTYTIYGNTNTKIKI